MDNTKAALLTPPKVELKKLDNLFFQLCEKSCNLKCKNCYIKSDYNKNSADFLDIEKVKQALIFAKNNNVSSLYLTGGEPLMHPDFNRILRMCLKVTSTTVITNGVMINDKKARFLRKIDDESQFETIYRISLDSTDELENDNYRARGSFRHALSAIQSLLKYEFNPIISVVNYKNRKREEIFEEFYNFFLKRGFKLEDINLKVMPYFPVEPNNQESEIDNIDTKNIPFDCATSRIVAQNGIYSCPLMVSDYRARMGSSLDDCASSNYLDCENCMVCAKFRSKVQVNDWV